jgi:uncharacterized protein (TIGR00730 family)
VKPDTVNPIIRDIKLVHYPNKAGFFVQRLCVFCGSQTGNRPIQTESARRLGRLLASRHIGLVYGAGNIGLMGVLADAVLEGGGEVIGVIPRALVEKEVAHRSLTKLHIVDTMHQRKALMADLADGFAALAGGFGTCDELFEILTWAQLGMHAKPIGILNVEGFYDPLLVWLDKMVEDGYLKPQHRHLLKVATTPEDLLNLLENHRPQQMEEKWIEKADR